MAVYTFSEAEHWTSKINTRKDAGISWDYKIPWIIKPAIAKILKKELGFLA